MFVDDYMLAKAKNQSSNLRLCVWSVVSLWSVWYALQHVLYANDLYSWDSDTDTLVGMLQNDATHLYEKWVQKMIM